MVGIDVAGSAKGADEKYEDSVVEVFQVSKNSLQIENKRLKSSLYFSLFLTSHSYERLCDRKRKKRATLIQSVHLQAAYKKGLHRTAHAGEAGGAREVVNVSYLSRTLKKSNPLQSYVSRVSHILLVTRVYQFILVDRCKIIILACSLDGMLSLILALLFCVSDNSTMQNIDLQILEIFTGTKRNARGAHRPRLPYHEVCKYRKLSY